jgi:chromosome segregation ATPase
MDPFGGLSSEFKKLHLLKKEFDKTEQHIYILHNMDHQDNVDNEWDLMSEWGSKTPKEELTTSDVVVVGGRSEEEEVIAIDDDDDDDLFISDVATQTEGASINHERDSYDTDDSSLGEQMSQSSSSKNENLLLIDELQDKIKSLEKKLAESEKNAIKLQVDKEKLQCQNSEMKEQNYQKSKLEKIIKNLKEDNEELKSINLEMATQIEAMTEEQVEAEEKFNNANSSSQLVAQLSFMMRRPPNLNLQKPTKPPKKTMSRRKVYD